MLISKDLLGQIRTERAELLDGEKSERRIRAKGREAESERQHVCLKEIKVEMQSIRIHSYIMLIL